MKTIDAVKLLCGSCLMSGIALQPALAQSGESAPPTEDISSGRLQEIVVTAQKYKEDLQKTPLAISAITAEIIEQRGTTNVGQLTSAAPNLIIKPTPGSAASVTIAVRGITEGDIILTGDSPIGIYVDGVIVGRQAGAAFDLVDLERVEVLRGPQGTLYGRNTIGGAVNLITARPADEFGVKQKFTYGNWNQWQTRTSIDTGQWGESGIRAKLSYVHGEQDGYVDDISAPSRLDPGASELDAARLALSFDRGDRFRADYAFDYNKRDAVPAAFQATVISDTVAGLLNTSQALGGNGPQVSTRRLDRLYLDTEGVNTDKSIGHTLTLEFDLLEDTLLRSLTGYREWDQIARRGDIDGQGGILALTVDPAILIPPHIDLIPTGVQPISLFMPDVSDRHQHQVSQEFNLLGKVGERLNYVAGVFYFKERSREYNPQNQTIAVGPLPLPPPMPAYVAVPLQSTLAYTHESESKAVFAQATYDLTDRLGFTGGVRYTEDQKELKQVAPFLRDHRKDFSRFNWSATLDFKVNDEVMTYGRVATGYKAGGMNARSANDSYKPEDLVSYELGVKSELFGRRLRLNAAVFYVDHEDMQTQQFEPGSAGVLSNTVNAGQAEYRGIEAEIEALLTDRLTFSGSFGYLDRDFKEFWIHNPMTDQPEDIADSARDSHSKTTATAALQYDFPRLSIGRFSARLEYNYRAKYYSFVTTVGTPFNDLIANDGRGLLDARLALSEISFSGADLSLALWGKNLIDEEYRAFGVDLGALGVAGNVYGEPRSYGVDLNIRF
jgi:iron complex outermembrane receptor protein